MQVINTFHVVFLDIVSLLQGCNDAIPIITLGRRLNLILDGSRAFSAGHLGPATLAHISCSMVNLPEADRFEVSCHVYWPPSAALPRGKLVEWSQHDCIPVVVLIFLSIPAFPTNHPKALKPKPLKHASVPCTFPFRSRR